MLQMPFHVENNCKMGVAATPSWVWPPLPIGSGLKISSPPTVMAAFQDKAKELYREIAQVPVAAGGRILRSGEGLYEVEVKWSQKDLDRGSKVTFAKSYLVRRGCNDMKGLTLLTTSSFQRDATSV